jgi:WD repeat and SOF domain-containing protein 1
MAKNPNYLKGIFSASMDGDIRLWDISSRRTVCQFPGHQGAVRGLTASTDGNVLVSCGTDCTVRLWNVPRPSLEDSSISSENFIEPSATYVWKNAFWAVDHQFEGDLFATAGAQLDIWNHNRSQPVQSFQWGTDSVISVRFNPGEPNLLATSARYILSTLYLYMSCNCLCYTFQSFL